MIENDFIPELQHLEDKLTDLLGQYQQLKKEKQMLQEKVNTLLQKNEALEKKACHARERIDLVLNNLLKVQNGK